MFSIGDLVVVINDVNNYIYKIQSIADKICLVGYSYRLIRYVTSDEIEKVPSDLLIKEENNNKKTIEYIKSASKIRNPKAVFGRILHIDGDIDYLNSCLDLYKEVGIYAEGIYIPEKEVYLRIEKLLLDTTPDIVVITGHDAFNGNDKTSIDSYENSKYFIKTIRAIRKHYLLDSVVIIAGACASHFEALIASGANFASSPKRINTHTYDPAVVAIKVASTPITKLVNFDNILRYIENGRDAIGGVETKGKMRLLL